MQHIIKVCRSQPTISALEELLKKDKAKTKSNFGRLSEYVNATLADPQTSCAEVQCLVNGVFIVNIHQNEQDSHLIDEILSCLKNLYRTIIMLNHIWPTTSINQASSTSSGIS